MTVSDWSDFHAWHVSNDALSAARLALPHKDWLALSSAAALAGPVPREAIEDAALAMPDTQAQMFLSDVYTLTVMDSVRLLQAIRAVRHQ